jgi:hypothetical protein
MKVFVTSHFFIKKIFRTVIVSFIDLMYRFEWMKVIAYIK